MGRCFILFVGLCVVLLSGCSGVDTALSEQEYLEKAKESLEQGAYNEAIIALKNAIKSNPNSTEGRYLLGELYVKVGSGADAEKELQRARELGVADVAIDLLMGDALLQQGKVDEIIKSYQINESGSSQANVNASVVLADAYFQKGDYVAAKVWFDKAQTFSADNERAVLGLARLAIVARDYDRAQTLIDSVMGGQGQQSQRAWLTLVDLKRAQNSTEEIIAGYQQAAKLSKSKQDYFYHVAMRGLVSEYLQRNNPEKAETELSTLKKSYHKQQFPDDIEMNQIRAVLAYEQKKHDVAADLTGKVLKADQNHLGAILLMGAISAVKGQTEQAEMHLSKFLSQVPNNIVARKLLAYVQMNSGHSAAAVDTLTPIVKMATPDAETLSLIAGASLRAGDPKKSAEYYQQALNENSDSSEMRAGLAQSYLRMGEFDKSISELNKITGEDAKIFATGLATAEAYIAEKNYPAAIERLKVLEQGDKANPLPVSLQGTVYSLMGNDDKAKVEFQRALKVNAGYGPAARSLALYEISGGDVAAAKKIYDSALKVTPSDVGILYDYAQIEMMGGEYKNAGALLKKAQSADKNKDKAAVLLARLSLRQGDPSGALSELRNLGNTKNVAVLAEMGNAQMMLKEYVNAKSSYKKLTEIEPGSALTHYLLYTAQVALGEVKEANATLKVALQRDGKHLPSLIAAVTMALNSGDTVTARDQLKKLETLMPKGDAMVFLKGDLAMSEKKFSQAATLFADLYKRNPNVDLAQKLGQAYWVSGNKAAALTLLTEAATKYPQSTKIQYALATAYQEMGDLVRAVDAYKTAIRLDEKNVAALNNLAWLLRETDLVQARKYAEKASELSPKNSVVKDTLEDIKKRQGH